jgi:hypothetical protein
MNKNTILFGGKNITVNFEPVADPAAVGGFRESVAEEIKVRQIPVREYETGFPLVDDEPALVAFLCGKPKPWALTLRPESYEDALVTGREVNVKGFFSYCQRRTERDAKAQADMIGAMANMNPETLKLAMEKGLAIRAQQHSPILSPGFVSPPAR